MGRYEQLRIDVWKEIHNSVTNEKMMNLLLQLLPLIPEDDEVVIYVPRETAEELRKFRDCYAPLLREVAVLCDVASHEL